MKLPKIRKGAEVRLVPRRQHPKSDVFHQMLLDPQRGKYLHAIAIDQNLRPSADGTAAGPGLPLHRPTRSPTDPVGPPRPTRNRPSGSPATIRADSEVRASSVQERRIEMFLP